MTPITNVPYVIKAYLFRDDNSLDCRFECRTKDFNDVIEFISRVNLDYYDRVLIVPEDFYNSSMED